MSKIISVHTEFPEHRYSQEVIMNFIKNIWPQHEAIISRLCHSCGVEFRNLSLPLESYKELGGFEKRNKIYIDVMLKTLHQAVKKLHEQINFNWNDLCLITSTTITGLSVPSLDARLMNLLPLPTQIFRTPIFGLGCLGGIASINRTHDLLKAYPQKLALILAAEACSLTFQFQDISMANMVACSLFGDGAAAVLMAGDDHPLAQTSKLKVIDSINHFYPQTEQMMGWDFIDTGLKVVLSGSVPNLVKKYLGDDFKNFFKKNKIKSEQINHFISHPGGPKVLRELSQVLEVSDLNLKHSWQSLKDHGNLSSVSVLNVLERTLLAETLSPGYALGLALGPGFNSEMTLIEVEK